MKKQAGEPTQFSWARTKGLLQQCNLQQFALNSLRKGTRYPSRDLKCH